ncbi:MAG TPA: DUF4388 domain-containing protein [Candidatus Eisenbacteria bacterium]|nr:DUF4388 domain-containing protein [Candidatus Eisenbacteria bacterium]
MALQGNLRDFAATEILQLVGTQKKSGRLTLEWNTERALVWVNEGRIVSTRPTGMSKDDPLLAFLRKIHRLSDEQYEGLQSIQKHSGRDLEDLLLNGRYLEAEELGAYLERQILDDLTRIVRWDSGTYRFDPRAKWTNPPIVLLSMEGAMIEASRRVDEQKRYMALFKDPYQLLGVRDLPDPDASLSEEERELFGIIDGLHTVADVVEAAPLTEYETYEALFRMLEANWIEFVGRRDPGLTPASAAPAPVPTHASRRRPSLVRELALAVLVVAMLLGLRFASAGLPVVDRPAPQDDVYAATRIRDLRFALDLYRREQGVYPRRLTDLVEDRWLSRDQLQVPGYDLRYHAGDAGQDYRIDLVPDR